MTLYEAFVLLRGVSLGILLIIIVAAFKHWRSYEAKLLIALAIGIMGYVLAPVVANNPIFLTISVLIADAVPLLFLLFAQGVFADDKSPAKLSLLLGACYYLCGYTESFISNGLFLVDDPLSVSRIFEYISRAIVLAVLAYGVAVVLQHWRSDLLEARRKLRLQLTLVVSLYITAVVLIETLNEWEAFPLWLETAHTAGIILVALGFAIGLAAVGAENLSITVSEAPAEGGKQTSALDKRELETLLYAMETECSYRNMELTISNLAEQISVPEHHLRSLINRHLGYRNFNDFLNQYRVAETADRLVNEKFAHLPIMTIAMDSGYRSMTTFNKAFKAITGKTPRDYRFNTSEK